MMPAFSANSFLGFRQYKYWRVSIGCKYVLDPNVVTLRGEETEMERILLASFKRKTMWLFLLTETEWFISQRCRTGQVSCFNTNKKNLYWEDLILFNFFQLIWKILSFFIIECNILPKILDMYQLKKMQEIQTLNILSPSSNYQKTVKNKKIHNIVPK